MIKNITIKNSPRRGRGVFALKNFKKDDVIERCHIIHLKPKDSLLCEKTILDTYIFCWRNEKDAAIALGYGSMYNHSYDPNAVYEKDYNRKQIVFRAIKEISKGEEIFVNYNRDPKDKSPISWLENVY